MTGSHGLDVEHVAELQLKPREEIEQDVKQIFESAVEDAGEMDNPYIDAGEGLLDYHFGMSDDTEYFAELVETFSQLGQNVAFLVDEYDDRGLADEEPAWLGHRKAEVADAGTRNFDPNSTLLEMPYMADMDQEELNTLHMHYVEGKEQYFRNQFDYGTVQDE